MSDEAYASCGSLWGGTTARSGL